MPGRVVFPTEAYISLVVLIGQVPARSNGSASSMGSGDKHPASTISAQNSETWDTALLVHRKDRALSKQRYPSE